MINFILIIVVFLILSGLISVPITLGVKGKINFYDYYGITFILVFLILILLMITTSQRETTYIRVSNLEERENLVVKDVLYTEELESGIYEIRVRDYIGFKDFKITFFKKKNTKAVINLNDFFEAKGEYNNG